MYCSTSQAKGTSNGEKIKSATIAVIKLHWSEHQAVKSVENSVKLIIFKILQQLVEGAF